MEPPGGKEARNYRLFGQKCKDGDHVKKWRRCKEATAFYGVATFSSSAFRWMLLPAVTFIFRSQSLKPVFLTVIVWSPSGTCTSEGVFPTKLPSISMSAAEGFDSICSFANAETVAGAAAPLAVCWAAGA